MKFIADEAYRLGINLETATEQFTKFSIGTKTQLSTDTRRKLFSGMSEYASVLQIDKEQYGRFMRSIQQSASKGQLYAEEVNQQMAEAAAGSREILAAAAGFAPTNEGMQAFGKAMEAGEIKFTDKLAKDFAEGLSKAANANGALAAVTKKTRAEMERFFATLTTAKMTIFGNGADEGLSYMFSSLSQVLEDFAPVAKGVGAAFKGMASTLSGALRLILAPLNLVTDLLVGLDISKGTSSFLWNIVGATGGLAMLAMGFNKVAVAIGLANQGLLVMMARLLILAGPLMVAQDLIGGKMGQNSVIPQANWDKHLPMSTNFNWSKLANGENPFEVTVNVVPDGSAFGKAVTATVVESNQRNMAQVASETGG